MKPNHLLRLAVVICAAVSFSLPSRALPPVRILPVGDSITYGSGGAGGYRLPLWQMLTNAGYTVDFTGTQTGNGATGLPDPDHEGHSGWRIDQIDSIIANVFGITDDPDVLLLMIGTNDFGQNYDVNNATNRLDALITKIVTNRPHCKLVVASLTVRGEPQNTNIQTNFNNSVPVIVANHAANGEQVYFTDMYNAVPLSDMPDNLHPNTNGYFKMATNWINAITNVISPLGTTNPPAISHISGLPGLSNVLVTFSKPVSDETATNLSNYFIAEGLTVLGASLEPVAKRKVTLTTDVQVPYTAYHLITTGVVDRTAAQTLMAETFSEFYSANTSAVSGVFANVPEAGDYTLVYSLNIPDKPNFTSGVAYDADLHSFVTNFTRMAYYLELQTNGGNLDFMWVSFDAITPDSSKIGVPTFPSGAIFQQPITNMNVITSLSSITLGTNLSGGNIEFWPYNYNTANTAGVPNASASIYDWGDNRTNAGNHGSMQVHNHDASQVLFGFNHWNVGQAADLGIGNFSGTNPDWTSANSSTNYFIKTLQVFALVPGDTNPPVIASAKVKADNAGVVITFSEAVGDDATNLSNYAISGGLTLFSAELDPTTKVSVTLTTLPLLPNVTYTATVNNVRDRTTNHNVIATNSIAVFKGPADNGVYKNVPAAADYTLVYSLNIPDAANYNTTGVPYEADNHVGLGPYSRIAYYLELQTNGGPVQYIWVEMDPFSSDPALIGVPQKSTGALFQQYVTNMTVVSSVGGIVEGTGINTGNIEFWPWNYANGNALGIPNAGGTYDWGDTVSLNSGNYGSMQIHNWGADLGISTGQVLFAFNNWGSGGGNNCVGIGSRPTGDPDWTFAQNAGAFSVKKLQVFVLPVPDSTPPTIISAAVTPDRGHVLVSFSEMLTDAAASAANFTIDNGINVLAAEFGADYSQIFLTVDTLAGGTFTLTVNDVRDRSANANEIATDSTVLITEPPLPASIVGNVPESDGYQLVYYLNVPASSPGWNNTGTTYTLDYRTGVGRFSRVAYYVELATNNGPTNWVWVSMDPFTQDANKIGVPDMYSGARFQQPLTNMNVLSSQTNITSGAGMTGNIEFWPFDYSAANGAAVPGASAGTLDFGDTMTFNSYGPAGYGSMQIHNASVSNVLFAYNAWGTPRTSEMGIGSQPTNGVNANPDWTSTVNANSYTVRNIYVLVLPPADTNGPAISRTLGGAGRTNILVSFDSPLTSLSANPTNFSLNGGVTVNSAVLRPNLHDVELFTSPQAPGNTYTVTVNNVVGNSTNGYAIAANSIGTFTAISNPVSYGLVSEATNYSLVLTLALPSAVPNYSTTGIVPYGTDLRPMATQVFDRIAYYLELATNNGTTNWIYVSVNAFTPDLNRIGVPFVGTGAGFQGKLTNMTVASSDTNIITGTAIGTGAIEFWGQNYGSATNALIPNGSGSLYDWSDTPSSGGHGSMQLHNYGAPVNGGASTGQVLFAFDKFGSGQGGNASLGLGSRPTSNPDWTFADNAATYSKKYLHVLLHFTNAPPTSNSVVVIPPYFVIHPHSAIVVAGASTDLVSQATGTSPAFQWYYNGGEMTGETNAWLTIDGAVPGDAGSYKVTASNSAGVATSLVATLSVTGAPPATGYDAWAAQIGNGLTNYNESALGDGYPNLLKYATGSNPTNADTLAAMGGTRTNGVLVLLFRHATNAVDVTLVVEGADTVTNNTVWLGIATNINGSWGASPTVFENTGFDPATVAVGDVAPASTNRFLRLRVSRP